MPSPLPLRPQELTLAIGMAALGRAVTVRELQVCSGASSTSRVHESLVRLRGAGLLGASSGQVLRRPLLEILLHAIRWICPAEVGGGIVGIPTAHAVGPLSTELVWSQAYVWPNPAGVCGGVSGLRVDPLHRWVYGFVREVQGAHLLFALTDSLRVGRARDVALARQHLSALLEVA